MAVMTVSHDHVEALGLTVVQGRFFSRDFPSDTLAVVINETAARQLGFKEIEGRYMRYSGNDEFKLNVVGVVKDFNFETLKATIRPMVIFLTRGADWAI